MLHDGLVDGDTLEPGEMLAPGSAIRREYPGLQDRLESGGEFGRWVRSSSRMVRARQTKIPEFQRKVPVGQELFGRGAVGLLAELDHAVDGDAVADLQIAARARCSRSPSRDASA